MRIVHLERNTMGLDIDTDCYKDFGEVVSYPSFDQSKTIERIKDADILLINKTILDRYTLSKAPNLKLICVMATGYDNVDIAYCKEHGIAVANAGHYSTTAVVQHTFMIGLGLMGNLIHYYHFVEGGEYGKQADFSSFDVPMQEIAEKTWGIVGMGEIGCGVAKAASAFGCKVIFFSPTGKSKCTEYERVSFEELCRQSDIISLHCPLSDLTRNLFGRDAFGMMKESAYLINVARGGVVDQDALAEALKNGKIAGAALDVLAREPIAADNPLAEIKDAGKLIITPHNAWAYVEARQRDVDITYENIKAFLAGKEKNRVV
ncbi:MAG: D-2-hydroxyacid dehydrogenase [Lachnospiraceae bacterium]|nr:D-2-hydroxyacid dehydrogenase [Lachnospiraceae bacterium]